MIYLYALLMWGVTLVGASAYSFYKGYEVAGNKAEIRQMKADNERLQKEANNLQDALQDAQDIDTTFAKTQDQNQKIIQKAREYISKSPSGVICVDEEMLNQLRLLK